MSLKPFYAQQWTNQEQTDSNRVEITITLNQGIECMRLYDDAQQFQFEQFLTDSLLGLYKMKSRGYQLAYQNLKKESEAKSQEIDFLKELGNDLVNANELQGIEIIKLQQKKKSKNIMIIGGVAVGFILGVVIAK